LLPFRVAETSTPGCTAMEGGNVLSVSTRAQLLERCVCIMIQSCYCTIEYTKGLILNYNTMSICLVCRLCRNWAWVCISQVRITDLPCSRCVAMFQRWLMIVPSSLISWANLRGTVGAVWVSDDIMIVQYHCWLYWS